MTPTLEGVELVIWKLPVGFFFTAETGSVKFPEELTEVAAAVTVKSDSVTEPKIVRLPVTVTDAVCFSSVKICSPPVGA